MMPENSKRKVSLLIPMYNEEAVLPALFERVNGLMDSHPEYDWEVLLVNDGSRDNSLLMAMQMRARDPRWHWLDLSRNFGKERAMMAGFDYVTGDCMIILDADLQDPPELIPEMLGYWREGYDDIYARRSTRGREPWLRRKFSMAFYSILQRTSKVDVLPNVGDFRLLDRICVDALRQLRETQRYTKGLFSWIGFRKKEILFDRGSREAGESKWSFFSLLNLAIEGITSFTISPLRFATVLGFIVSVIAFILMCFYMGKALIFGDEVQGFPTLITAILFLGGTILLSLGIIGEYVGRIFLETKNRPGYLVRDYDGTLSKSDK